MPAKRKKQAAKAPAVKAEPVDELSEYERQRLEHIRRNHEYLVLLGLAEAREEFNAFLPGGGGGPDGGGGGGDSKPPRAKKVKADPVPEEDCRCYGRVKGDVPDYSGEKIDRFGEQMDNIVARSSARRAKRDKLGDSASSLADVKAQREEMLEEGRR